MKFKRAIISLTSAAALILAAGLGFVFYGQAHPKMNYTDGSTLTDHDNLAEFAGYNDYVFIGKVISEDFVKYVNEEALFDFIDIDLPFLKGKGPMVAGDPYTSYSVTVIENIKGELPLKEIKLIKAGGTSRLGVYTVVDEGDYLPKPGDVCVFFASVEEDGSLYVSGPNSTVLLETSANGSRSAAAADTLSRIKDAVANEIPYVRERFEWQG